MPQIRCPNCGLTINLENRKDTDIDMITNAVKHDATTFTDLLRTTKLPRKTLSIRLKELCQNGTLAKMDGLYKLNGGSYSESRIGNPLTKFSNAVHDKRMRGFIMLGLLLIAFPTVSFVLASLVTPMIAPEEEQGPAFLGTFKAVVSVNEVNDLYAWEAVIMFNPNELQFIEAEAGELLEVVEPSFTKDVTPLGEDSSRLMVGASLLGSGGVSGSGSLAIITFGYYVDNYQSPQMVEKSPDGFETYWLNTEQQTILLPDSTMQLIFP